MLQISNYTTVLEFLALFGGHKYFLFLFPKKAISAEVMYSPHVTSLHTAGAQTGRVKLNLKMQQSDL